MIVVETTFDELIEQGKENVEGFPEAYFDHALLQPLLVQKGENFQGMKHKKLLKKLPILAMFVNKSETRAKAKRSTKVLQLLKEQKGSPIRQTNQNVSQTKGDHLCSLGQFFWMVRHLESKLGLTFVPNIEMLLSPTRISAYTECLFRSDRAGQTVKNKMLHLNAVYEGLLANPALQNHSHRIRQAQLTCKDLMKRATQNKPRTQATVCDEEDLITRGEFFAAGEQVVFNRWCLERFNDLFATITAVEGIPTLEEAIQLQDLLMTLVHDFVGGQRRQVTAEMEVDGIDWKDNRAFFFQPGSEKVRRSGSRYLSLPLFLQG